MHKVEMRNRSLMEANFVLSFEYYKVSFYFLKTTLKFFTLFLAQSKDLRWIHLWFFCEMLFKVCFNNNHLLKNPTPQALVPACGSHWPKWRLNVCCRRENLRLRKGSFLYVTEMCVCVCVCVCVWVHKSLNPIISTWQEK